MRTSIIQSLVLVVAMTAVSHLSPLRTFATVDETSPSGSSSRDLALGDVDGDGDVDLDDLVARIGDSSAIGLLTKLSLKRDIDAFERDLKRFHDGQSATTLDELQERYDLLVHKLLSLLQDKDPELAGDISRARDFLWAKLADAEEFSRM